MTKAGVERPEMVGFRSDTMVVRQSVTVLLVIGVIYLVPFVVYGVSSRFMDLPAHRDASPQRFLSGVLVAKLGTAVASR